MTSFGHKKLHIQSDQRLHYRMKPDVIPRLLFKKHRAFVFLIFLITSPLSAFPKSDTIFVVGFFLDINRNIQPDVHQNNVSLST